MNISFPEDSKFLVTGGAGFIGSNLVETILKLGYQVRVLDNFSTGKIKNIEEFIKNEKFELIEGDIRDLKTCEKACIGVDYVLHQAAWGSVPRSIEHPLIYEEINIKGFLNMLEAAKKTKVKKFVYASSSSVYGDSKILPKVEGKEGNVLSPYALTKKVDEEYANLYFKLYGLKTIGMRYFNIFGKKQDPNGAYAAVIPKFIKQLLNNEIPIINGDGKTSRDFTYIENVVQANLKACLAGDKAFGKSFNIGCGGQETLVDLYNKIAKLLNKNVKPKFEKERLGDVKHSNADITKAKRILKYEPEYSIDKGLDLTIKWYKENLE